MASSCTTFRSNSWSLAAVLALMIAMSSCSEKRYFLPCLGKAAGVAVFQREALGLTEQFPYFVYAILIQSP